MFLVSSDEMRDMDHRTITDFGIPGRVLMENAGRGAVRVLMGHFPDIFTQKTAVIAGRGNNGGDGFVIARYLAQAGCRVTVYLLSDSSRLTGDASANFNLLAPLGIAVREIPDERRLENWKEEMALQDIWVDAIFGTGLNADVTGVFKAAIHYINALGRPVFAVDIPSGVNADTGAVCGACITAAATATFAFPKIGHVQFPGAAHAGALHVVDIGIPPHIAGINPPRQELLTRRDIKAMLSPRPQDTHKGRTGHVLAVAGSRGKTGAAGLCALGALRAGAGLVTLGVPESCLDVAAAFCKEVMTAPLPETIDASLSDAAFPRVMALLKEKKCLALGPGLGTDPQTGDLVARLVRESPAPMVLDADGLNLMAGYPETLAHHGAALILTPHPGEMARLTNRPTRWVQENRLPCARDMAVKFKAHVILKGARTLIAHPDGRVQVNSTGNPGMACAGMGDVLTGMVAGYIAQGYPPDIAAPLAVYLHGLAADRLVQTMGPFGFLASDVADALPSVIAGLWDIASVPGLPPARDPILEGP